MIEYSLLFLASFMFVFLKAFQQLNVVYKKFWWVLPTSLLMASAEVLIMIKVVENGWGFPVLFVGLGGGLGCMASMFAHKRFEEWVKSWKI